MLFVSSLQDRFSRCKSRARMALNNNLSTNKDDDDNDNNDNHSPIDCFVSLSMSWVKRRDTLKCARSSKTSTVRNKRSGSTRCRANKHTRRRLASFPAAFRRKAKDLDASRVFLLCGNMESGNDSNGGFSDSIASHVEKVLIPMNNATEAQRIQIIACQPAPRAMCCWGSTMKSSSATGWL